MYAGSQKFGEAFQKAGKDGIEATVRSLGEDEQGLTGYCRKVR